MVAVAGLPGVSHVTQRNSEGSAPTTLVVIKGHEIASIDTTVALVSASFLCCKQWPLTRNVFSIPREEPQVIARRSRPAEVRHDLLELEYSGGGSDLPDGQEAAQYVQVLEKLSRPNANNCGCRGSRFVYRRWLESIKSALLSCRMCICVQLRQWIWFGKVGYLNYEDLDG